MTTISLKPLKSLSTPNVIVTELGCDFTGHETDEEVVYIIRAVKTVNRMSPFTLADIYNTHPELIADEYDHVYDVDGYYTIGSIRAFASSLKNWPKSERRWLLGISFYQAVYHLPKMLRDSLMDQAVQYGKGRDWLRQEAYKLNGGQRNKAPAYSDDIIYDQDRKIYVLENKVIELEIQASQTVTALLSDCDTMVADIKAAIDELYNTCPDCVGQIREYVEDLK